MTITKEELVPILFKRKWTDFYGAGQVLNKRNKKVLLDCGEPTARIVDGKFELLLRHPETELEFDLIREFAWQNGFKEINDMKPRQLRTLYGVMPKERRKVC